MIHIVDFCRNSMGAAGTAVAAILFLAFSVLGIVIAVRGRGAMIWLVSVCAFLFGLLAGSMIGILVLDSIIAMILLASVFGVMLVVVVKRFKSIGYFIGISTLGWLLSTLITSEMYIAGDKISENSLLFIDLMIGLIMGIMAACRSKYLVSVITAVSGGVITAISSLALIGFYFADIKTWIIAIVVSVFGLSVQIRTYDLAHTKPKKKK